MKCFVYKCSIGRVADETQIYQLLSKHVCLQNGCLNDKWCNPFVFLAPCMAETKQNKDQIILLS